MRFLSTEGRSPSASLREALWNGLAPDGGLYTPDSLAPLPDSLLRSLSGRQQDDLACRLAVHLLGDDLPRERLDVIVKKSLGFPIPLVEIEEGIGCLELFHGPTLAFKDVGARFMAQLMLHYRRAEEQDLTVLVATSGDTGAAVAHAFLGLDGFRVVVLYPEGQVSEPQQKLFTTLGDNITSLAVAGAFDDCQRLVKAAFADVELRRRCPLASANSINVGRLLPQIFYYFFAVAQLPCIPDQLTFCIPSGNFGNLTAGLLAKRMGLPARRFIAATNVNDTVPRYLASGRVEPRPSVSTLSNAMDVGDPSNLSRIRHLYGDDVDALRQDLVGSCHTDEEVLATIQRVYDATGYVLDPHSAIGYLGLRSLGAPGYGIFLATAHPAKFADTVALAIGRELESPPALADRLNRSEHTTPLSTSYDDFRSYLVEALG